MKKNFDATGRNGTFRGEVEVRLNAETRTKSVHNRGTHDEETIKYYIHQIRGKAAGKEFPVIETEQESKVPVLVVSMEKQVMHHLEWESERPDAIQPLNEILKARGYN